MITEKGTRWYKLDLDNYNSEFLKVIISDLLEKSTIRKDDLFIKHIQEHLTKDQEVICKICGKSAKKIIHDAKRGSGE